MGDLAPYVGAGVFGVLAFVILHLLSTTRAIPKEYGELVDRVEAQAKAAEERERATQAMLAQERQARWAAEDRAEHLARQLRHLGGDP